MRIAAGGFEHETNTFSNILVTEETVKAIQMEGDTLIRSCRGVRNTMAGLLDECEALGIELVPMPRVDILPCGVTEKAVYEAFRDHFVEELWKAHCQEPLDAIALNIHGAAVAEGYPDLEADFLKVLRDRIGMDIPIGLVLDLHGNITQEMMDLSNITVAFKEYPHTDTYESSRLLIKLLHQQYTTDKTLYQALVTLPWQIAPAFGVTMSGAAGDVKEYNERLVAENPELYDVSFFHGFPYADVDFAGASITAVAETRQAAEEFARRAAKYAWSRRHDFAVKTNTAEEAMELASKSEAPVVINETSDNPGGGAPGDGTHLLREMIRRNLPGSAYGHIYDPEVVQQAIAAGVGSRIDCEVGAKLDNLHGTPVALKDAYVKTISDGTYIRKNPMGAGGIANMGPSVLLQAGNVSIVVTSARRQTLDDGPFRMVGIDWQDMKILALKSSQHFKGWWTGRAKTIIACDSPGIHCADLTTFDYKHLDTSFYPFKERENMEI
ncbi:MAG: M81 family metallopeptidase [Firmicutes bacterium]|nr:M81 family metallopeptidase [Bacillota bacterium]